MSTTIAQPDALQSSDIGARAARHLDLVFRSLADASGVERNAQFMRLVTGEPHPMGNLAIVSVPDAPDVAAAAVQPLVARDLPAAAIFINGVSAPVAAALTAAGFHADSMPAMAVAIEQMTPTQLPAGYAFEPSAAADSKGWTEALADGLAGIYCVATLPAERGKGLGAHVTAEALRRAHAMGYRVGILQSSAAGHTIYLRLGFEDKLSVPMFIRMPA
jgi:ribosomal protein S18 acetylase RimI-like enzyme